MVLTAKPIGEDDALRIGLVNRVATPERLEAATTWLVDELLANAPIAVGVAKRVLDAAAKPALAITLEMEVAAQDALVRTADFSQRVRAVMQKHNTSFMAR